MVKIHNPSDSKVVDEVPLPNSSQAREGIESAIRYAARETQNQPKKNWNPPVHASF